MQGLYTHLIEYLLSLCDAGRSSGHRFKEDRYVLEPNPVSQKTRCSSQYNSDGILDLKELPIWEIKRTEDREKS